MFYKEIVQSQHLQYLFALQDIFLVKNVCFMFMGTKTLRVTVSYIMENLTNLPIFIFSFRHLLKEFSKIAKYNPVFSYKVNWAQNYQLRRKKQLDIPQSVAVIKDEEPKQQAK